MIGPRRTLLRSSPPVGWEWSAAGLSSAPVAWLYQFKRLLVRNDRRDEMHEAILGLACCLITPK